MTEELSIDIETYSDIDLLKTGVYKYVEDESFEILMFAYSFNNESVQIVDLKQGETLPLRVINALINRNVIKTAFNANFERTCINKFFLIDTKPEDWQCTMVKSLMFGYPGQLEACGMVMNLNTQKDKKGKALIKYFSYPCKPSKANGMRVRNLPEHDPEKWNDFKKYCVTDVEVEKQVKSRLDHFHITHRERELWCLDQKINDRGIMIDKQLVFNAIKINKEYTERLTEEAIKLTGMSNPNSPAQIKQWLLDETMVEVKSLSKKILPDLIKTADNAAVKRMLEIRKEMSKSSIKKFNSMWNTFCSDHRIRGTLQYYGANRTGRWAGRNVQTHNLVRNNLKNLGIARRLVRNDDLEMIEIVFGDVSSVLSELVRTAFIPKPGCKFIISDFSAIEARVIAWLAGEKWRLEVFKTHGKIYEASASQMFKVPIESVTKGSALRDKGKISELALGYQGSVGALERMGAYEMGLTAEELPELVKTWRMANREIVKLWSVINEAAIHTVQTGESVKVRGCLFYMYKGIFFIRLPSGRVLSYLKPSIVSNKFDLDGVQYYGIDQVTKQWVKQDTYGGKLVENIVQAIARDCLADSIVRLDDAGYDVVLHVHDEIILEVNKDDDCLYEVDTIMSSEVEWGKGLPLKAEGFESDYYIKNN